MPRLVLPDSAFLPSYVEALREGYYLGVRPTPPEEEIKKIEVDPHDHFEGLNYQGGTFTPEDGIPRPRVAHNYYWLVEGKEFIGGIALRYALNDFLEKYAGHIGYGIRPKYKRQGYAKKMLALGLQKMKERGVIRVLVTADEGNTASWRTIEANGGVLENKVPSIFHPGSLERRYWIDLT
jgi:predicted acetyltransferase